MNEVIVAQVLETLNRIEIKVDSNYVNVTGKLERHMADQDGQLATIKKSISTNKGEAESRHSALMATITAYMNQSLKFETAFLKTHEGLPDFAGHFQDHHSRKTVTDWIADARNNTLKKVFEYCSLAFLAWLVYSLWHAFLKGPGQ